MSEFILTDTLNKSFSFWFPVLHILEMWSLNSRLWSKVSPNIFSDKLFLMIISSHEKSISKSHKMTFSGIQDQEVIIKPYFKCTKFGLKFVYYLIKCFFTRKLGIVVSIIVRCWIFSKWKYIIYEDKYGTLQDTWCNFFSIY